MKLTDRQTEVLIELESFCRLNNEYAWARPLDLGGRSRSHHSATLGQLEKKGLVKTKPRPKHMTRPSKHYRITDEGIRISIIKEQP